MKKNNKGFTLIELLAVIVILGLLMAIAIPSVTRYITQSRVKTLAKSVDSYVTAVVTQVNDRDYSFSDSTKVFAVPIECIALEKGGTNPLGNWMQANDTYWAYVLVHYDHVNFSYEYGFTFKDSGGYGLYPTNIDKINDSMIKTGYDDLKKPENGLVTDFIALDKWSGFNNISSTTKLVVLNPTAEGGIGNGTNTCTLMQKGDNYEEVEKSKCGDLDLDGDVDSSDMTILSSHVARIEILPDTIAKYGDVDEDGDVDAGDLTYMSRHVARIETLPCLK